MTQAYDASERQRMAADRSQAIAVLSHVLQARQRLRWVFWSFVSIYPFLFGGFIQPMLSHRKSSIPSSELFDYLSALALTAVYAFIVSTYWLLLRNALSRAFWLTLVEGGLIARAYTTPFAGIPKGMQTLPKQDQLWQRMLWLTLHYHQACKYYRLKAFPPAAVVAELVLPVAMLLSLTGFGTFLLLATVAPEWTGRGDLSVYFGGFFGLLALVSMSAAIKRMHNTLLLRIILQLLLDAEGEHLLPGRKQ